MTATTTKIGLASRLVNTFLGITPLANFAKSKARKMMIDRAEELGVSWRDNVNYLSQRNWESELNAVENKELTYPEYYLNSFHAYESGNLSWLAAWEVESAAYAVHAKIWEDAGVEGDAKLRASYHQVLQQQITETPQHIVDIGCGVGMSTLTLQEIYPEANLIGIDLSPYFLAVAQYRAQKAAKKVDWVHNPGETTKLPDNCCDLVSACLVFHELPDTAAKAIIKEAYRILRPGGHLAIMDMNPQSETFLKMPPYILTLLKSTEPYLDRYFALDVNRAFTEAGFWQPTITVNSPRHRTIIGKIKN
jgi:ubiquinone/menaquinone biosynthesis C-methylase UbiE